MFEDELKKRVISPKAHELIQIYVERLRKNNVAVIFNLRHLRKILRIKKKDQNKYFGNQKTELYRAFRIPKKAGGWREIEAPEDELKVRQTWIKENILDKVHVSSHAMGFRCNTSIYDNALPHVNKALVMNVDIKDFFPSIPYKKVFKIFVYLGYTKQVSHLLTKMCTNAKGVLPQGAPTSPVISNIVMLKLDRRLGELAKKMNCAYTRYADDITFSGSEYISSAMPLICKIINEEGFKINQKKVRFQYSNQRQEVTGLTVNKKVSLPKTKIRELENAIYYCKKYGVQEHMNRIECNRTFYKEHLYGMAYFFIMIDKEKGSTYLKKLDEIEWLY